MKQKFTLILLNSLFVTYCLFAQSGTIKGKVIDAKTHETIVGANVVVKGTTLGAVTDINGNYLIRNVKPGNYTLVASFISYTNIEKPIRVEDNKITQVDFKLSENVTELKEFEVVTEKVESTELSVVMDIRKAEQVVSGISAQQIQKSQDRDASEVIRRVPGITIMNNRFVIVRGLSERYNAVMLNDVITPSMESDARSFSFDVIPSSAIERMLVFKSGSPEYPGDFAGGVVKIYSKNTLEENKVTAGLSLSYRPGTTLKDFYQYKGSSTDFLGFDNGTRQLPSDFPTNLNNNSMTSDKIYAASKSLPNIWTLDKTTALPDIRFNVGANTSFKVGETKVSNLTNINYSNTFQFAEIKRVRYLDYDKQLQKSPYIFEYYDKQSRNNVRAGILHNWAFKFSDKFKLDFKNLFNQVASSEAVERSGMSHDALQELKSYAMRYSSRSIYMGQLIGEYKINDDNLIKLTSAYAYTNAKEPDFRRYSLTRKINTNDPFVLYIPYSASTYDAARFYSNLNENVITFAADYEKAFKFLNNDEAKLKVGIYNENKNRTFQARWMSYIRSSLSDFNTSLLNLPMNEIFAPNNMGQTGFKLSEGTNKNDKYDAANTLVAGYVAFHSSLTNQLKISGGVRIEYNRQQLNSMDNSSNPLKVDNPITSILPSINLSYNYTEKQLIRLAYAKTINRPDFRELAPFSYYDFNLNVSVMGNPDLKIANIHNYDLRWEFYPTPAEIISVGVFYKKFINPIEQYVIPGAGAVIFKYDNAELANNYGAEIEIRKSFAELFENNKILKNTNFVLNTSVIKSQIELKNTGGTQDEKRPMMGQSPFIINTGVYYNNEESKLQVNLLYNVYGKRIFTAGTYNNPTIYEMPRNLLDLNIVKGISEKLEIRFSAQDILNQYFRFIQDSDRDGKITNIDEDIIKYRIGSYYTLGFNYKF